jgi:hypothetical protein
VVYVGSHVTCHTGEGLQWEIYTGTGIDGTDDTGDVTYTGKTATPVTSVDVGVVYGSAWCMACFSMSLTLSGDHLAVDDSTVSSSPPRSIHPPTGCYLNFSHKNNPLLSLTLQLSDQLNK